MQLLIGAVFGVAAGLVVGIVGTSWYYEHKILAGYTQPPAITTNGIISPRPSPGTAAGGETRRRP